MCRYRMGMSSAIFHLPRISVDITANCEFYFCPCWHVLDAIVRNKTYFYFLRQTGNLHITKTRGEPRRSRRVRSSCCLLNLCYVIYIYLRKLVFNAISISDDVLVVFSTYRYTIMGVANGAGTSYPSEAPVSAVTQWVSLMDPELLTLQKHRFQPWLLSASWFTIFSFFCSVLWIMVFPFVSDLLAIVLCVL